jgi:pSer/pThr/pTyr-binding forkhead associated (FHA) protein
MAGFDCDLADDSDIAGPETKGHENMRKIHLTHLSDQRKGEIFEFAGEVLHVGRGEWNELIFAESRHTMVSRNHAEIARRDNAYVITDQNSSTGTFLNGEKISHAVLKNGDVLRFGLAGPEVSISIPSIDMKATVVMSPLQAAAKPPDMKEVPSSVKSSGNVTVPLDTATPKPQTPPKAPQQTVIAKDADARSRKAEPTPHQDVPGATSVSGATEMDLAALQAEVRRLTLIAGCAGALLLLLAIFAVARVFSVASSLENHAARLEKLDTNTGELLLRLSNMDTKGIQQAFDKKSREMDQRGKQLEKHAQDMERKFQAMFDQKSKEVDYQFDLLGEAYPQVKSKMDKLRRQRRN